MKCRFCHSELRHPFVDLGSAPPSNSFMKREQLNRAELYYPLKVMICEKCFLVQIDEYKKAEEIFSDDYVYFSSMSSFWLEHSKQYVDMIVPRLGLTGKSRVIEIASNDGYMLQFFKQRGIPSMGIEPTASTAEAARIKGIEVIEEFFGVALAKRLLGEGRAADLVIGDNVLAHVPDINDFVEGLKIIVKQDGTITMEFPHLMKLVQNTLFDMIYHEHFSYLSFTTVRSVFAAHGLEIYDVEELPTQGGSLRIYACRQGSSRAIPTKRVSSLIDCEKQAGMGTLQFYEGFQNRVQRIKLDFLAFLLEAKNNGKKVAAYGAAAKGNTLLNYCGVKNDLIEFVVDAAPSKQGRYLPGSRIPVHSRETLAERKPDYVLIFPWNIREEIVEQVRFVRDWGAKFVIAIPRMQVF
jgi:C-methyltransferase C-terminal domain/Putative zinc binding domain/Methyltransferase domain